MSHRLRTLGTLKRGFSLTFLAVGVLCCSPTGTGPTITWQEFDPAVLDQAREQGRPVILEFYADWCIPCKELERFTFSDPRVLEATTRFVRMRVDLSDYDSPHSESLRRQFGVTGVPEIVFVDTEGNEVREARVIGFLGANDFLQRVKKAWFAQSWTES